MQIVRGLMLAGVAVALGFGYSGCENKGAGEKAGAAIGKAVQTAGESVEKAGKEVQKSAH